MSDSFTKTTSTSWFSRLGSAIKGIVVGIILIPLALGVLFWNEGRAVKTAKSLKEGASVVRPVGIESVDPANEGKLVHISGPIVVSEDPVDPTLGVSAPGVRLLRKVEMFQWSEQSQSETRKKLGGGEETVTTYTYNKDWNTSAVSSANFQKPSGHENPPMPISGDEFVVPSGKIGSFTLTSSQLGLFGKGQPLPIQEAAVSGFAEKVGTSLPAKLVNGAVVLGASTTSPQIGDLRISYSIVAPSTASIVAAQTGDGFGNYKTSNGRTIFLTENGAVPATQMFATAQANNKVLTWVLRVVGLFVLFIGFTMIMAVAGVAGDVVPFLGSIVRFGTGLIAFVLTVLLGFFTISIAWIFYRPLVGIGILLLGAAIAALVVKVKGGKGDKGPAAPKAA
jgi:Transmembrane protein 43